MANTFVEITNERIYQKILDMEKDSAKKHLEICEHLTYTNGKVRLNKWLGTTAMSLIVIIIGFLVQFCLE